MNRAATNKNWRKQADRRGPKKLLALELAPKESKAVVLSRSKNAIRWEKAVRLPAFDSETDGADLIEAARQLAGRCCYLSIVSDHEDSLLRIVGFPGRPGAPEQIAQQVRQTLGVDDSYALTFDLVGSRQTTAKPEYSVLSCAMPKTSVGAYTRIAEKLRLQPVSLTVSGVALANLLQHVPDNLQNETAKAFLYLSKNSSDLLLYCERDLVVVRNFQLGEDHLLKTLMEQMDLDRDTAAKLYESDTIDIANETMPVLGPWLHQILISLDFCERRHGRPIKVLRVFGETLEANALHPVISSKIGRAVMSWSPDSIFNGIHVPNTIHSNYSSFLLPFCEALRLVGRGRN